MTTTPAGHDGDVGDVRLRQASQEDLLAVLRIERKSFQQPWPFSAFERYLGAPAFLVAEERPHDAGRTPDADGGQGIDGKGRDGSRGIPDDDGTDAGAILGYVVADLVPNHGQPLGHVKDIAVHPDRRGEGLGKRLLARALAIMESHGAHSVKLEVRASNDAAISMYQDFGFEYLRSVPRYYQDGEDALILVADLGGE